jgi:cell division protein FtsQ
MDGCNFYSEQQLEKKIVNGMLEHNSIFLYIKYRYFKVNKLPFIQKISIERNSNHEITIHVYEKTLIGCIRYMNEYIYFDKDGIVLETSEKRLKNVPYIAGIHFIGFTMYGKVTVEDESVFDTIYELSRVLQKYKIIIDKINLKSDNEVSLVSGDITILLGKKKFYDEQFAALSSIIPKAQATGKMGILDMTNYEVGESVIFKQLK